MSESSDASGYLLERNSQATLRLIAQHWLFTKSTGWLIDPTISKKLSQIKSPRIADLACGSGIWSLEVLDVLPGAHITAVDVSPAAFPPAWARPSQLAFVQHDLFQPIPDEFVEAFDMVHLGVLVMAFLGRDQDAVISNILKMLKPGGYLQWRECTPYLVRPEDASNPRAAEFSVPSLWSITMGKCFGPLSWLLDIPLILKAHGFTELSSQSLVNKQGYLHFWTANAIAGFHEFLRVLHKAASPDMARDVQLAITEAVSEIDRGRMYAGDFNIITARKKPLP